MGLNCHLFRNKKQTYQAYHTSYCLRILEELNQSNLHFILSTPEKEATCSPKCMKLRVLSLWGAKYLASQSKRGMVKRKKKASKLCSMGMIPSRQHQNMGSRKDFYEVSQIFSHLCFFMSLFLSLLMCYYENPTKTWRWNFLWIKCLKQLLQLLNYHPPWDALKTVKKLDGNQAVSQLMW